jgi:predicted permease
MGFGRAFRRMLSLPARSGNVIARDVDEELRFHLDMRTQELIRRGVSPADAERQAKSEFGDLGRARASLRAEDRRIESSSRRTTLIEELNYDLRFAARQLLRNRGFTVVAVLTLGLGIGANTAIFSAVRGILLRPLPFTSPDRLVRVYSTAKGRNTAVSVPDFVDFRAGTTGFSGLAAWFESTTNFTGDGTPERFNAGRVTSNFFPILGATPLLGRLFLEGEDLAGAPRLAVLSEGLWKRRFGADPMIVGRRLVLDGEPVEVIGVLPDRYRFPENGDLWLTTRFTRGDGSDSRGARWIRVIGRLAPGVSEETGRAQLHLVAQRLEREDPKHNAGYDVNVTPLQESIVGELKTPLYVLLGAVALVMLVACVNVAGLLLGRTTSRDTEMAVRVAMGAGRGRIVRQLLTESLLLSLLGALVGYLIAIAGTRLLVRIAPPDIPRLSEVRLDGAMLAFTAATAMLTGLIFGLVPALHASAAQLQMRLRQGARGMVGRSGRARTRRLLVVSEISLAIMLLVGAGLLLRSFTRLREVDPGFSPENNTVFTITLPESKYPTVEKQGQFVANMTDRLQRLPGTQSVGATFGLPLSDTRFSLSFTVDGRPAPADGDEPSAQVRIASVDYFRTMGIRLLRGRTFTPQDRLDAPQVILISEQLARRFFPNEEPIGKSIRMGWTRGTRKLGGEVVGVVADVKQFGLDRDAAPALYAAADQWPFDEVTFVVSSQADPASLATAIRGAVHEADPDLPIFDYRPMKELVSMSLSQPRFYMLLLGSFAGVALLLAAIGLYGVIAYAVQQRTREIGVRMALGATRQSVLQMVIGEGLGMTIVGVVAGLAGAAALTGLMRTLLFGITATDPVTFASVAGVLTLVAITACVVPARRAASVDPQQALRSE